MKKTTISIIASSAIFGAVLVGCGGSGGGGGVVPSANLAVQASVVNKITARGGLVISHENTNCENISVIEVNSSNEFVLSPTNMKIVGTNTDCDIIDEPFVATVYPLSARALEGNNDVRLADKIGTTPLKGVKGKKVNIFSTIAIANGIDMDTFEEIDANDEDIIAIKNLIQNMLALGTPISALVSNNANTFINQIRTAATSGNVSGVAIDFINEIIAYARTAGLTNQADITNITTDIRNANATLASEVETAATKPKLNIASVGLTVGSQTYTGSGNNFDIVRLITQDVGTDPKVTISLSGAGFAGSGYNEISDGVLASNATLKALVTKDNKNLTITLNGVTIRVVNGALQATVAQGATLDVDSTFLSIDSVSGILDRALTTTDLSFDLDTLISAITVDQDAINIQKTNLINKLNTLGEYELTVGISGLNTAVMNNLVDQSTLLGEGFKGFTGEVLVGTQNDINQAKIADVIDDIQAFFTTQYCMTQTTAMLSLETATEINALRDATIAVVNAKIAKIDTALAISGIRTEQTNQLNGFKTSLNEAKTTVTTAASTAVAALTPTPTTPPGDEPEANPLDGMTLINDITDNNSAVANADIYADGTMANATVYTNNLYSAICDAGSTNSTQELRFTTTTSTKVSLIGDTVANTLVFVPGCQQPNGAQIAVQVGTDTPVIYTVTTSW